MEKQRGMSTVDVMVVAAAFVMLAAVAVPRFAFLSEEARVEAVRNLAEDVRASSDLTFRVWDSAGRPATLTTDDTVLELVHGYPSTASVGAIIFDDSEFEFDMGVWHYSRDQKRIENCFVSYEAPRAENERPNIAAKVDGC